MPRRGQVTLNKDVWTLALERMNRAYDLFDRVMVAFSGGKDSTVVMQAALEVAKQRGQLPLDLVFFDEEILAPETVEYLERVRARDDVRMHWYCLPVTHRNACSTESPFWWPWDPACPELWTREQPPWALTSLKNFARNSVADVNKLFGKDDGSTTAMVLGIRADESLSRRRGVTNRREDNYIIQASNNVTLIKPIYDWRTVDVWVAPQLFGWDYNRAYDVMNMAGISPSVQRVAPPFGEQPFQNLWMWAVCWPELWDKMVDRVPGAAAAARYSRTVLYGRGGMIVRPPEGMSWQEAIAYYLDKHPPDVRAYAGNRIRQFIRQHREITSRAVPDDAPDPLTGVSWPFLLRTAMLGDLKGRTDPKMKIKASRMTGDRLRAMRKEARARKKAAKQSV